MKKKLLCISVLLLILLMIAGCGDSNSSSDDMTIPNGDFGNLKTGAVVSLGMDQAEVEGQFKNRLIEDEGNGFVYYVYDGLSVTYDDDDKVDFIFIDKETKGSWETKWGIKIGDSLDSVIGSYGEPEETEYGDSLWFKSGDGYFSIGVDGNDNISFMSMH